MGVLREIKAFTPAIHRLSSAIQALIESQRKQEPSEARLTALEVLVVELELDRSKWEAEIEAQMLRADSTLKAARNAEERARKMKKAYEKDQLDPFDIDSEQAEDSIVQGRHAPASEEEGMLPLHLDVAPTNSKAFALRAKYSL